MLLGKIFSTAAEKNGELDSPGAFFSRRLAAAFGGKYVGEAKITAAAEIGGGVVKDLFLGGCY